MSSTQTIGSFKLPRPPQRPPACRACKRRKSKCDFEQPCSTCLLHHTVDSCHYDTMAVPRERRSTVRSGLTGPSARAAETKNLKSRLADAEQLVVAQQKTIESLRATVMAQCSSSHATFHESDHLPTGQDSSKDVERDDEAGRAEEDGKTQSEGLADKMTRLVIGSAIAPNAIPSPPAEALELPDARGISHQERGPHGEAQQLKINVLALLASHNNSSWAEFARGIGLNPSSHATTSPPYPLVSNTILPEKETISTIHGLVSLFPPTKSEALALLDNYLGFVNLVHHVVDGPQTRFELELFYDLLSLRPHLPVEPSPMPVPPLLEPGWLSAMLAIFTLADKSDRGGLLRSRSTRTPSESQRADTKCKIWLEGSLQGLRMRLSDESTLDLTALRSVCLVVWVYVLYGQDDEVLPAVNLNSRVLYRACDKLQLHRDPSRLDPSLSHREAEDRRRVFYNLINTDWLFSAISGKTYSPVGLDGHDVRLPHSISERDPIPFAISGLAFRSLLMRQLRRLATLALRPGQISQADAAKFEMELDRLDRRLPDWCEIDVDNFPSGRSLDDPQQQAEFSQQIITNVQLCAVRVRFHTKFASPGPEAPPYITKSASHHRAICISRAVRLLRLEQLHLKYSTRILGHSGYPRFHPIVGGLTLSALMAKSSDPSERQMLFEELSRFTAVIHSYGALSQVTNLGILAIETALVEVRRGVLAEQSLRGPNFDLSHVSKDVFLRIRSVGANINDHIGIHAQNEKILETSTPYYTPVVTTATDYHETPVNEPNSRLALLPSPQSQHNHNLYSPLPIMIPRDGHGISPPLRTPLDVCCNQSRTVNDPYASGHLMSPSELPRFHTRTISISPKISTSRDFEQLPETPENVTTTNQMERLLSHLGDGVGYEGLMVEWMGAGANISSIGNESCINNIPMAQSAWKQEW